LKGIALFFVVFLGFSAFGTAEEDAAALAGSEVLSRTAVQALLSHCYHFKRGNFRENTSLLAEVENQKVVRCQNSRLLHLQVPF